MYAEPCTIVKYFKYTHVKINTSHSTRPILKMFVHSTSVLAFEISPCLTLPGHEIDEAGFRRVHLIRRTKVVRFWYELVPSSSALISKFAVVRKVWVTGLPDWTDVGSVAATIPKKPRCTNS